MRGNPPIWFWGCIGDKLYPILSRGPPPAPIMAGFIPLRPMGLGDSWPLWGPMELWESSIEPWWFPGLPPMLTPDIRGRSGIISSSEVAMVLIASW